MLLGSPRLCLQQLLRMLMARHSMHTFCAVSSISTAPSLFRIDAFTSLGSFSQFRVVSFFFYTFFGGIFGVGFLEIGIFAFDFDFGQWSGNEIPKVLVCILLWLISSEKRYENKRKSHIYISLDTNFFFLIPVQSSGFDLNFFFKNKYCVIF